MCVGLDPVSGRLPDELRVAGDELAGVEGFCLGVIDAVAGHVPCVKVQAACFERYHAAGFNVMFRVLAAARAAGLIVILDAKRGDIGISSEHYAAAFLGPDAPTDALTVHSYLGDDSLTPYLAAAAQHGKGVFPMVRTSNPGGETLQALELADGRSISDAVADMVARLGDAEPAYLAPGCGYSLLGAVVGATKPAAAATLRARMKRQIFLVPGFGAQGAGPEDVRACFNADTTGAIISASRSVLYAFAEAGPGTAWQTSVADAARRFRDDIASLLESNDARAQT